MIDLDGLEVTELLGVGGQGKVWLAHGRGRDRPLVLKWIAQHVDATARERVVARLQPFLGDVARAGPLPVFEARWSDELPATLRRSFQDEGLLLVLPFVDGETLAAVRARSELSLGEVAAVVSVLAEALAQLPVGVAHGDLKAANVLCFASGQIALADPNLFETFTPRDDLRALGCLGFAAWVGHEAGVVDEPPADLGPAERRLHQQLARLLDELRGAAQLCPAPAQIAATTGAIAHAAGVSLSAPLAGKVVKRELKATRTGAGSKLAMSARPVKRVFAWWNAVGAIALLSVLSAAAIVAIVSARWAAAPAANLESSSASESGTAFDPACQTHHTEPCHVIVGHDHVDCAHGYFRIDVTVYVKSIAIENGLGEVLWTLNAPKVGSVWRFDLPPGRYVFVQVHAASRPGERDPRPLTLSAGGTEEFQTSTVRMWAPPE